MHLDLRADNLLLSKKERVLVVDWPHARVGIPWVDVAFFAPSSVAMQGGPSSEELMERHPQARRADPDALTAVVAPVAGFFTREGLRPVPARLPTLWAFQAAQGEAARSWQARRTGLKQVLSDSAPLFTGVRGRGVLATSRVGGSPLFA